MAASLRSVAYFGVHTAHHSLLCFSRCSEALGHFDEVDACLGNELVRYRVQRSCVAFPSHPRHLERVSHRKMHDAVLSDASRSPCSRNLFATCSYDDRIRVWTLASDDNYKLLACEPCGNVHDGMMVDQICWSPCGTRLASTTRTAPIGRLQVWSFEDGKLAEIARVEGAFQRALFNQNGHILAFTRSKSDVTLYQLQDSTLVASGALSIPSAANGISAVAMSPNLSTFVCSTRGKQLIRVDAATLEVLLERPSRATRLVSSLVLVNEHVLLYSPSNGQLLMADLESKVELSLRGPPQGAVLALTPDRQRLVSATLDGLYIQSLPPLSAQKLDEARLSGVQFHSVAGCGIDISPSGSWLASGDLGRNLVIWATDLKCPHDPYASNMPFVPFLIHQLHDGVRSLKWLPESDTLLVGCLDGQLLRASIDPVSRTIKTLCLHRAKSAINCIEVCSSGEETRVVAVDSAGKGSLLIVSRRTTRLVHEWLAHPAVQSSDPAYRRKFGSIHRAADAWSCIWSPDGNLLATCSEDQSTRIWDMRGEPRLLQVLKGHTLAVTCADWVVTRDTVLLATCADDKCVMLWETRTPKLAGKTDGYCEDPECFAFVSPGYATCAAHTEPCTLRHVFTAQEIASTIPGWFTFTYLRFLRDHLVVGTENGFIVVLDLDSKAVVHARCIHRGSIEGLCLHSSGAFATISSDCSIALHLIHNKVLDETYGHARL